MRENGTTNRILLDRSDGMAIELGLLTNKSVAHSYFHSGLPERVLQAYQISKFRETIFALTIPYKIVGSRQLINLYGLYLLRA